MDKDLDYYLSLKYPYRLEMLPEDNGKVYLITYPDLPGCVSDGDTAEKTISMGEDARKTWIETRIKQGSDIPEPFSHRNRYSGRIALRTPRSLHKRLVDGAEREGVSLNQYLVYLLSKEAGNEKQI